MCNRSGFGRFGSLAVAASFAVSAFADAGDLLYMINGNWSSSTAFSNMTDHVIGALQPGQIGAWQSNAVLVVTGNLSDNCTYPDGDVSVYGIDWRTGRRILTPPHSHKILLGAGGIASRKWCGGAVRLLTNRGTGGTLRLVEDQAWHNNGEGTSLTIATDLEDKTNLMRVEAATGVTLTLREAVYFKNMTDTRFGGNLVISDTSSFTLKEGVTFYADDVTLQGEKAKLYFAGGYSNVAESFTLKDGAVFVGQVDQLWDIAEAVRVSSGECRLEGKIISLYDPFVVNGAAGAKLVVTAAIVNQDGLPVAIQNTGAGTLDNRVHSMVDEPPEEPVVVNSGYTLNVYGNGLTSAASVELAGGTIKIVNDGVTVAAPITVTAASGETSAIDVVDGIEGRFSGTLTHEGSEATRLYFQGNGTKVFTGNATFKNGSAFSHIAGNVVVSNAQWTIIGTGTYRTTFHIAENAQRFYFGANSKLSAEIYYFDVNASESNTEGGILEFGEGSEYYTRSSGTIRLMNKTVTRGTLRVSGGYLHDNYVQGSVEFGCHSFGRRSRIEFLSGKIEFVTAIGSGSVPYSADYAHPVFYWKGGTFKVNKSSNFSSFNGGIFAGNGIEAMEMIIDGPDCVLDYANANLAEVGFLKPESASANGRTARTYCTENGVLTLTNSTKKTDCTFVIHNTFTNMNLRICENAHLRIDNTGKSYPFEFKTVEKAGAGALGNVAVYSGATLEAETLKGCAGIELSEDDLTGWTYSSLAFEEEGIWRFAMGPHGADTLELPGKLTLPLHMYFASSNDTSVTSQSQTVISAAEGTEAPEGAKVDALKGTRKLHYKITEDGVNYYQRGLMVVAW